MRLRGCGVAVGAVLLGVLAACGGGSSGAADPSSPLPITTTPLRSSVTTSPSASIDPNSDAAILAGVQRWANALTRSAQTADIGAIRAAATPRCSCIQGTAQSIDYLASHHLHLNVDYNVVTAVITAHKDSAATVHVVLGNGPYQALNSDGSIYKNEPPGKQENDFSLKRVGQIWRVDTIF